jgi:SAM-dependent methyltransferase
VPATIGVDMRKTAQTKSVCDIRQTCFRSEVADEVYSFCVLEHLRNPYELMDEVVRVLKPDGRAYLRVPNIGTFSAHLDPTHLFLADLKIWKAIMRGYFKKVVIRPEGLKYRDNLLLSAINLMLVKVFRFYELAQGWTFICEGKRAEPTKAYIGWWIEGETEY